MLLFSAASPAAAESSEFPVAGTLRVPTTATVVVDTPARRLLTIRGESTLPLAVSAHDGDSLRHLRTVEFSYFNQGFSTGRPTVFAFDERARRLHLVAYRTVAEQLAAQNPLLVTIDVDRFTVAHERPLARVAPPGFRIFGMSLDGSRLLVVAQKVAGAVIADAPRVFGVIVSEIDPGSGDVGGAPAVTAGPIQVRGCQAVISSQSQAVIVRDRGVFYLGCATSTAIVFPLPGVPAVVAVPERDPNAAELSFLPGSYSLGDMYYDPSGRRLLLVGSAPERPAQAVWIFDLKRRVFLGQIAAGDLNLKAAGVDPTTGRVYVGITDAEGDGSLMVSSDRGLEIPQAVAFPAKPAFGVITPVPFSRMVLVPHQAGDTPLYRAYRDRLPASAIVPGEPIDYGALDRRSSDEPQYSAGAQAFGVRVHEIGGVNGAGQNAFPNRNVDYWQAPMRSVGDVARRVPDERPAKATELSDGDRMIDYARIADTHLSEADASASAVSTAADEATDADHNRLRGGALSTRTAACRDFGDGASSDSASGSTVSCGLNAARVEARSESEAFAFAPEEGAPLLRVGAANTSATLERTANGEMVVRVRAEARDIVSGDTVIGLAVSEAVVRAAGRRGGAQATYTRSFENVRAGTFSCSDQCPAHEVLRMLSATLGAQVRVEMPAEEKVATGGGAHAHALRDIWEHQQDVVTNNQPVTESQIPALRFSYIGDNAAASRVIVELAAAGADATVLPLGLGRCIDTGSCPPPPPPCCPPPPPCDCPPPVIDEPRLGLPTAVLGTVTREIPGRGWALVSHSSFGGFARAAAIWAIFATPAVLALRRRRLTGAVRNVS